MAGMIHKVFPEIFTVNSENLMPDSVFVKNFLCMSTPIDLVIYLHVVNIIWESCQMGYVQIITERIIFWLTQPKCKLLHCRPKTAWVPL